MKLSHIQDLEKEHYYTKEKIKQLGIAIENAKHEEQLDSAEKYDLQRILN